VALTNLRLSPFTVVGDVRNGQMFFVVDDIKRTHEWCDITVVIAVYDQLM
jgi:hypothetical protein